MYIPRKLKELIKDQPYSIDEIGKSDSSVIYLGDMILKVEKQAEESDNEKIMMRWLADKLPVPQVLYTESENGVNYLLMSRITGKMSCSPEFIENPNYLVRLLADGLKRLWSVDTVKCPYTNSIDNKLRLAEIRVKNNLCDIEDAEPITYGTDGFESPEKLLKWLQENRPKEELVFSHGDYCLPNLMIHDGKISGFIDLGRSGIADKYQDIALCYRSLLHKYNEEHGKGLVATTLFEELNLVPDWNKIKYFILLDELF